MKVPCGQLSGLSDKEYWSEFAEKLEQQRIPFSGGIALTHRCNLKCLHCYAKEDKGKLENSALELSTEQWKKIIAEIGEAGCLYLLITGGEPLLRDDFADIYSYAKRKGFLITIFSNGTMINSEVVELFKELPPQRMEITIYGASSATYDRITGVPGSFERCLRGVEMLLASGISVALKGILMTLNLDEFSAIEQIARNFSVDFRLDAAIFPTFSGDRSVIDLRVTPEQAVATEFANPEVLGKVREFLNRFHAYETDYLYPCSAGTTIFHIDPYGCLYPCLMVRKPSYSLLNGSFQQGWNGNIFRIKELKSSADSECRGCQQKLLCGFCPGFFGLENDSEQIPSPYLCAVGKLRYNMLNQDISGG